MRCELLALDVDGVLVGPDNVVSPELADAVAEAAGVFRVVLATGRSYRETVDVWRRLSLPAPHEPLVLVGGALVAEPDTGRALRESAIDRDVACEFADALNERGHSAAVIVDAWRNDVEYYLAESDDASEVLDRWFSQMDVPMQRVERLSEVRDLPRPLRINACAEPSEAAGLAGRLAADFDGRLNIHAILAPNYGVTIVEAFADGVSKWQGLCYVAQRYGIGPGAMVAVGDDINDVEMVRGAGLGVAMPRATDTLKAVADTTAEPDLPTFLRKLTGDSR
ncbi:MAG: HAD-IIB family hydrolase [Phycisphaerae bacterium]